MVNIAEIVNQTSTIKALDLYYESQEVQRRRLGLSQVGHKCPRFLWYKHRGYDEKPKEGRVLRLFELGDIVEEHIANDLESIGVQVTDKQKRVEFTFNGILLHGSIDGIVTGIIESIVRHLWECKTMNDKGFKRLLKCGYEEYNEIYKAQLHAYMLGLGLNSAFVTVYNKNDSTIYQERIALKKDWIVDKLQDVFSAITMAQMPERACPRIDWYEAKWCDFYEICFK